MIEEAMSKALPLHMIDIVMSEASPHMIDEVISEASPHMIDEVMSEALSLIHI